MIQPSLARLDLRGAETGRFAADRRERVVQGLADSLLGVLERRLLDGRVIAMRDLRYSRNARGTRFVTKA